MKSNHWITQTKRGAFTPRSKKLKAIDDALAAFELKKSTPNQVTLFNALLAWLDSKGADWRSSTRNSKTEPGGKGTVETLLNDVIALNPQFQAKANKYLQLNAPPPPPLMAHGAKNRQKDGDGHWYEIPVQTEENSCGPCSIRMVVKQVKNEEVGEDLLRELVEMAEEGGAYSGSLGTGGVLQTGGAHNWSVTGGGTWLVPAALNAVKIPNSLTQADPIAILLSTTPKKPAIGVVKWDTGGGLHYVVAVGKNTSGNALTILDPFYGVQSVPVAGNVLSKYQPINVSTGAVLAVATWYPWVCKVN